MLPELEKVKVPVPELLIVEMPPPLNVNKRFVDAVTPVYFSIPPLPITKLAAANVEAPMLLATPPSASVETERVPLLIVVTPV